MIDIEQAKQELAKVPSTDERSSNEERLRLLLAHSKTFYRKNPKQAEKWAKEALKLSTKLKNGEGIARAHYNIGATAFQQAQYGIAETSFKKAIELDKPEEFLSPLLEGPIFSLGLVYSKQGKFKEAFELYEKSLALCKQNGSKSEVSILCAMGNAVIELADYPRALKYLYDALSILDKADNPINRSIVLTNIGGLYLEIQDFTKADSFFERSTFIKRELRDYFGLFNAIHNRGIIASKRGDNEAAESLFSEAFDLAKSVNRRDGECYILESLGNLKLDEGYPTEALKCYGNAIEISRSLDLKTVLCASLIGLGKSDLALKQPSEAIEALQEALDIASESGMRRLECDSLGALAQAYEADGKLKEAVQYYSRFIALNATINSQDRQRAIVEVQARVEIDKADRERARMEIIAKDANDRAELLRHETERQSKELTGLALQLVEKNEFLCNLKEEIEPAIKSTKKAKAISRRIDDHIKSDRDWETFENQFNQVHGSFLRELSTRYPILTPAELKIAVLTRLNLPTKAMANLLCLSVRTVENHRQSIRKKLQVASEESLISYLTGFGKIE